MLNTASSALSVAPGVKTDKPAAMRSPRSLSQGFASKQRRRRGGVLSFMASAAAVLATMVVVATGLHASRKSHAKANHLAAMLPKGNVIYTTDVFGHSTRQRAKPAARSTCRVVDRGMLAKWQRGAKYMSTAQMRRMPPLSPALAGVSRRAFLAVAPAVGHVSELVTAGPVMLLAGNRACTLLSGARLALTGMQSNVLFVRVPAGCHRADGSALYEGYVALSGALRASL